MAKTQIADVIIPEVFDPYVINRTMELSALYQSGIIQNNSKFNSLASQAAEFIQMPFWNDLSGEEEILSDSEALTPGKINAGKDIAVIHRRGKAWSANDLAGNLAGSDPMRAIGDLVASYWARRMQAVTIATLNGIFASTSMAGNIHDISAGSGAEAVISADSLVDAAYKLGDAEEGLTGIIMHSAVAAKLKKLDLIEYVQPSGENTKVPFYLGKRVIIDDALAATGGVYTTYLFGAGALALGNGSPVDFVATETDRDSLAGDDILINRKTFIIHPRGVAFNMAANIAGVSPTNAELAVGTNWNRVYEPKQIRIVQFKHRIATA